MSLGNWASVAALSGAACILGASADLVRAQESLSEITVTAEREKKDADAFQTTTQLSGEALQRAASSSLADLLATQPGIAASTFAPGASRPNIRGLDDYRVRIQENGIGSQDASDFSQDHQVPVDPLTADKVEVIRGPATPRYGNQAIGGVVNAINNRIPEALVPNGFAANIKGGGSSADSSVDGAPSVDASGNNIALP